MCEHQVEFIVSEKKRMMIFVEGHKFAWSRENSSGVTCWRCYKKNCSAQCKTVNGRLIEGNFGHSHAKVSPSTIERQRLTVAARQKCTLTKETPAEIVRQLMTAENSSVLQKKDILLACRNIYNERKRRQSAPVDNLELETANKKLLNNMRTESRKVKRKKLRISPLSECSTKGLTPKTVPSYFEPLATLDVLPSTSRISPPPECSAEEVKYKPVPSDPESSIIPGIGIPPSRILPGCSTEQVKSEHIFSDSKSSLSSEIVLPSASCISRPPACSTEEVKCEVVPPYLEPLPSPDIVLPRVSPLPECSTEEPISKPVPSDFESSTLSEIVLPSPFCISPPLDCSAVDVKYELVPSYSESLSSPDIILPASRISPHPGCSTEEPKSESSPSDSESLSPPEIFLPSSSGISPIPGCSAEEVKSKSVTSDFESLSPPEIVLPSPTITLPLHGGSAGEVQYKPITSDSEYLFPPEISLPSPSISPIPEYSTEGVKSEPVSSYSDPFSSHSVIPPHIHNLPEPSYYTIANHPIVINMAETITQLKGQIYHLEPKVRNQQEEIHELRRDLVLKCERIKTLENVLKRIKIATCTSCTCRKFVTCTSTSSNNFAVPSKHHTHSNHHWE